MRADMWGGGSYLGKVISEVVLVRSNGASQVPSWGWCRQDVERVHPHDLSLCRMWWPHQCLSPTHSLQHDLTFPLESG